MHNRGEGQKKAEQNASDERLAAALEEIQILREQVKSLETDLLQQQQKHLELEQELVYTNQELCNVFKSERLSLDVVEAVAQIILRSERDTGDIAKLLSSIYGLTVIPDKLGQMQRIGIRKMPTTSINTRETITKSRDLRYKCQQLHSQFKEFGFQFVKLRASHMSFKEAFEENKKVKEDNRNNNHFSPPVE